MTFVSIEFFALLAVTVALVAIVPAAARKAVLLLASGVFYFSTDIASSLVGLGIVAINFGFLRAIVGQRREELRDRLYLVSVGFNLLAFVALKLAFEPAPGVETEAWSVGGFLLGYPVGLSFIILMLHAAVSDAYSGKHVPRSGPATFFLYGTFFPYVTSGPVERLDHMEAQLDRPAKPSREDLRAGIALIALGVFKKVVAANRMGPYVEAVFAGELPHSGTTVAIAVALNVAYLYCDFSGYTDIARGAARCLGIDVRINFDKPFRSRSVTEFWRRWHISFSTWLRDYLYMPLAYSLRRVSTAGPMLAVVLTFLICGFWHRAAWTFLLFGLLHGTAMALEMRLGLTIGRKGASRGRVLVETGAARLYTLVFLGFTIVLFPAASIGQAGSVIARLFTSQPMPWARELFGYLGPFMFVLMMGAIVLWQVLERWHERLSARATPAFLLVVALLVLFIGSDGPGFIYDQF